jgi:hypothetical protein
MKKSHRASWPPAAPGATEAQPVPRRHGSAGQRHSQNILCPGSRRNHKRHCFASARSDDSRLHRAPVRSLGNRSDREKTVKTLAAENEPEEETMWQISDSRIDRLIVFAASDGAPMPVGELVMEGGGRRRMSICRFARSGWSAPIIRCSFPRGRFRAERQCPVRHTRCLWPSTMRLPMAGARRCLGTPIRGDISAPRGIM